MSDAPTVFIGDIPISQIMIGDMGIKRILIGDTEVYNRPGGYFYLELDTKGEISNG